MQPAALMSEEVVFTIRFLCCSCLSETTRILSFGLPRGAHDPVGYLRRAGTVQAHSFRCEVCPSENAVVRSINIANGVTSKRQKSKRDLV